MEPAMLRRYLAEFIGTFALVFAGSTMRAMVGGDTHDLAGVLLVHLTFGFTIAAMIYNLGNISGAHFNPAITLGYAVVRRFPWRYVLPYWLAQFAGAILGSTGQFLLIPDQAAVAHFAATIPHVGAGQAVGIELVLTFFLMLSAMATGTDKRISRGATGIIVGLTVMLDGFAGNFLTGGSMNPARSLAPALFAGSQALSGIWIYFVGPIIGALLGGVLYEVMRGDKKNAMCVPKELCPAAESVPEKIAR